MSKMLGKNKESVSVFNMLQPAELHLIPLTQYVFT